jgi:hypothetical protein
MYTYSYSVRREGEDCLEVSSALYRCMLKLARHTLPMHACTALMAYMLVLVML